MTALFWLLIGVGVAVILLVAWAFCAAAGKADDYLAMHGRRRR